MEIELLNGKFCRFCLRDEGINYLEINENILELYFELTLEKLKLFTNNLICDNCIEDLNTAINIKRKFLTIQQKIESQLSELDVEIKDEDFLLIEEESIDELLTECPTSVYESSEIEKHIKTQKSQEVVSASQCAHCGIFVKNLKEHDITHKSLKRFYCDHCSYSCYFRTKIARHLQKHIPKSYRNLYSCTEDNCEFHCSRKDALKAHILTIHQSNRKRNFPCEMCNKSFFNKSQLKIHVKAVHEKVKNNTCSHCGRRFFTIQDLNMHEARHFEKQLKCSHCESLFFCKADLRRHFKNRHTEAEIPCEVPGCLKMFHTQAKLRSHIKSSHERDKTKQHTCHICSSTFSQFNNLKRHIDSVHKAIRISCVIQDCSYSVSRKDKYKIHLKSHHADIDEKTRETILKGLKYE